MEDACHLLVVDNDPEICEVVRACFEEAGYRVTSAVSEAAAAIALAEEAIDFALIDIVLPDAPGGHSLAEIARDRGIPYLLMTGHPMLMEGEADRDVLRKPFRLADLMQRVVTQLGTRCRLTLDRPQRQPC